MCALEMLEDVLKSRKKSPQLFNNLQIDDPKLSEILDAGLLIPLIEKDAGNRQVIILQCSKFAVDKFSSIDVFRLMNLVVAYFLSLEECQVAGFVFISLGDNTSMKHLGCFSTADLLTHLRCIKGN